MLLILERRYRRWQTFLYIWFVTGMLLIPPTAWATDTADVYIKAYMVGGFFQDRPVSVAGVQSASTNVRNGVGAGLRVGVFPGFTSRVVGFELEYFGTDGRFSFLIPSNGGVAEGNSGLAVLNSMANLVVRHPNGPFHPYVGFGIGYSSGMLHNAAIPGGHTKDFDSTASFAYQFLLGFQGDLTERTFLFLEYKRLAADFHWDGMALDLRANYVAGGLGFRF
ncbi:OMP_b-brl domain-containing protein [Nitrospira tepida]|uniref:OMP_b-brl domain-containing protein n=2 Tax=Nitrospira tepida TaxID=2973512 RepID=A0AA86N314_9BACT|nr:OMP_b-brl domain-containing protein [Nitrospira tepida]